MLFRSKGKEFRGHSELADADNIFQAYVLASLTDTKGFGQPLPNPQLRMAEKVGDEGMKSLQQSNFAQAEVKLRESLELFRKSLPPESIPYEKERVMEGLVISLAIQGKLQDAELVSRELLELHKGIQVSYKDDVMVAWDLYRLASLKELAGNREEASKLYREMLHELANVLKQTPNSWPNSTTMRIGAAILLGKYSKFLLKSNKPDELVEACKLGDQQRQIAPELLCQPKSYPGTEGTLPSTPANEPGATEGKPLPVTPTEKEVPANAGNATNSGK